MFRRVSEAVEELAPLSFSQVRQVLMHAFKVDPHRENTFTARLQQLQKLRLPQGTNVREGAQGGGRAKYYGWHLAEIGLYLDLLDAGTTPAALDKHFGYSPFYPTLATVSLGRQIEAASDSEPALAAVYFGGLNSLRQYRSHDHDIMIHTDAQMLADQLVLAPVIMVNLTYRLHTLKRAVQAVTGKPAWLLDPFYDVALPAKGEPGILLMVGNH
jgi:hypothetical protein